MFKCENQQSSKKFPTYPYVRGSLLQKRRVGGIIEFVVFYVQNAVEEGLNDPFRDVALATVDRQGRDFDLRESVDYSPRRERTGPTRLQVSY